MTSFFQRVTVCFILCCLAPQYAQASPQQPDETALLTGIFPSGCHFSGRFLQKKTIRGIPTPLTSTGDFYYSCDLGLIWHTQTPFSEAILYVNSSNNFKAGVDGSLAPLTGTTRYIMSNIFVRLLKGDTDYFVEEFAISKGEENTIVTLRPENEYLRKGLDTITISKALDQTKGTSLSIGVLDATGQLTNVLINNVEHYSISGKREAFEHCEMLYADTKDWCQVLRSPTRY